MARDAGANKVYFASASPPIRYPNVYGIDMPYVEELIAHNKTIDEICNSINADKLIYQDLEDLPKILTSKIKHFFTHYKDMETEKWVKVQGFKNKEYAIKLYQKYKI